MYNVAISTLHSTIINLEVETTTLVSAFKQQCMDASPFHLTPLSVNSDLAAVMSTRGIQELDHPTRWEGVRVVHWDGRFLDDEQSLGAQATLVQDMFLFKLVFMKQSHFSNRDKPMLKDFADLRKRTTGYKVQERHGTPFVVMPVWGGQNRPNELLGVFYQHQMSHDQCQLKSRGVDIKQVHHDCPVFSFQF